MVQGAYIPGNSIPTMVQGAYTGRSIPTMVLRVYTTHHGPQGVHYPPWYRVVCAACLSYPPGSMCCMPLIPTGCTRLYLRSYPRVYKAIPRSYPRVYTGCPSYPWEEACLRRGTSYHGREGICAGCTPTMGRRRILPLSHPFHCWSCL